MNDHLVNFCFINHGICISKDNNCHRNFKAVSPRDVADQAD